MGMTIEEAIKHFTDAVANKSALSAAESMRDPKVLSVVEKVYEANELALEALKEKAEQEKPPVTFGDQVRRMDDEALAWQFASLFVGGMGGVMKGIGMKPNVEDLLSMAYLRMIADVTGPAKLEKEEPHEN